MEQPIPADSERLRHARDLVTALESGDADAEVEALNALLALHEKSLHSDLSRIAHDLREALSASQFGTELSQLARSELPDAQHRLNRVIELTESAAETSLGAVERALPLVKNITTAVGSIRSSAIGEIYAATLDPMLKRIVDESAEIEKCLSDVLLAQSFQDITGQIIRRIVKLVAELEQHLSGSGAGARAQGDAQPQTASERSLTNGRGPAIAGLDKDALQRQQDVDELLGNLGI